MFITRWLSTAASRFKRYIASTTGTGTAVETTPRLGATITDLFGGTTNSALSIATVYRCVKLISESVANLPMQVMRLRADLFASDYNSRLYYLLNVQPDDSMSAYDFWVQVVQNMLLHGNAYIVPVVNPISLEYERLVCCSLGSVSQNIYDNTYIVSDAINGIYGVYDEDSIIHLKNISLDGKQGLSVLSFARLTLGIAQTGDNETLTRFSNGGNVRGIVSNDKSITGFGEYQDKELEKTAASLDTRFSSGEHIVSVPGQVDFKQISLSSTDMQFLESRKFTVREVCRFFGVHPSFVFDDTSNNYKSAEMANVAFLSNTLNPILRKIETEFLRKLVSPSLAGKRKFQFDRTGLYACDLISRVGYQTKALAAGIYTVNELRAEENKPALEGGDAALVSANLRPVSEAGKPSASTPTQDTTNTIDENAQQNEE